MRHGVAVSPIILNLGLLVFERMRARYRRGRSGKTVFPLEMILGIEDGFTSAAVTRVGKAFAAAGSTQTRTREMIEN